ncbi:BON domain-containing protein [Sphingobacterium sp. KU25419]|nr:BON domain-containing protein [Sphingobacterium sp. KU25419]
MSGKVNSWYEKNEVERIVWNTRGIWHVKNNLAVDYYHTYKIY